MTRVIWVGSGICLKTKTQETATVDPSDPDLAKKVTAFDDAEETGNMSFGAPKRAAPHRESGSHFSFGRLLPGEPLPNSETKPRHRLVIY